MKYITVFVLLLQVLTVHCSQCFSDAIKELVYNFFSQKFSNINIIKGAEDYVASEILSEVLSESEKNFTIRLDDLNSLKKTQGIGRKKFLVLTLVKPKELLKGIENHFNTKAFSRNAFFLVALYNESKEEVSTIFNFFWKKNFYNVNILIETSTSINMLTCFPFFDGRCGDPSVQLINEFDRHSRTWMNSFYYPKKFKNLHKCKLICASTATSVTQLPNGSFRGPENEIINIFTRILNFTAEHRLMKSTGRIYSNGSGTQVMKKLFDNKVQIASGSLQLDRTLMLSESYPFNGDPLVLVIPPGQPFSPIEKLYKTFDKIVWAGIVAVLVIALLLMKIVSHFVTDCSPKNAILNMINAFLGGSVMTSNLPIQHFSRLSLTTFLLYALVVRTAYTAILYDFLRFEVKHKEVSNVDEMIENYFSFYAYDSLLPRLVDFNFYSR